MENKINIVIKLYNGKQIEIYTDIETSVPILDAIIQSYTHRIPFIGNCEIKSFEMSECLPENPTNVIPLRK